MVETIEWDETATEDWRREEGKRMAQEIDAFFPLDYNIITKEN